MYSVVLIFTFEGVTGFVNAFSKANNKFFVISFVNVFGAVLIIIDIPAIIYFGLRGHIVVNIFYSLSVAIFGYYLIGYRHKFKFDFQKIKKIVKLGFSMSLIGYAWIFFSTSDRLVIIRFLPSIDLGYYSLVNTMALPLTILIQNFNSVIFVELNKRYGKTNSVNSILEYLDRLMVYQQRILPYVVGILIYTLPIFIKAFLPKYIPGILPAQISAFGILVYAVSNSYQSILVTINKNKVIIWSFFIVGVFNLILCYIAVQLDFGITGTAFSMAISYIILSFVLLYYSFKYNGYSTKDIFIKIWRLFENVTILVIAVFISNVIEGYRYNLINVSDTVYDYLNLLLFVLLAILMTFRPIRKMIYEFNLFPKIFKKKNG
jgi:O-antigen/teichoic acid export membrane protein